MLRYPNAEWVPWQRPGVAFWASGNQPVAVVLHIMAGYAHTARDWAAAGHDTASWHFTVARDGSVMQHLELTAGGFQAGIPATNPNPTWGRG